VYRSQFTVWFRAARNQHYVVTAAGLISILVLIFNPLASAIFVIGDTYVAQPSLLPLKLFDDILHDLFLF
jgi:hypothetical protein